MDGAAAARRVVPVADVVRAAVAVVLATLTALVAVACGSAGDDLGDAEVDPGVYQVQVSEEDLPALEEACDDELSATCGGVTYLRVQPCSPQERCVPITVDVRNGVDAVLTATPTADDPTLCERAPTLCAGVTLRAADVAATLADATPEVTEPAGTTSPPEQTTAPPPTAPPATEEPTVEPTPAP